MAISFIPGRPRSPGPLSRFLPPLDDGVVAEILERAPAPQLILDPFGSSPDLVIEAAMAGRPILVGANNPITRFILMRRLEPLLAADLQKALAAIGDIPKNGGRLESFLLELYATTCSHCSGTVTADYFVWEAERSEPVAKAYVCPHCGRAAEDPTTFFDVERAHSFDERGLQRALALGKITDVDDPLRQHAEAVLEVYPSRAIYALMTLITKIDTFADPRPAREAIDALVLSACDAADSLWAHPEGRWRPKQLTPSPRFRELNLWRAMERSIRVWSSGSESIPHISWPEDGLPEDGQVALFSGPVRALAASLPESFNAFLLTIPPRPNQAFWSLSTLWAAWIWGEHAAEPIKASLRRKRYDWGWHASALRLAMAEITSRMLTSVQQQALLPESEPGFHAACLSAWDACGWRIDGAALRADRGSARLRWRSMPSAGGGDWRVSLRLAMEELLLVRGEPSTYDHLHLAGWSAMAGKGQLTQLWEREKQAPVTPVNHAIRDLLTESGVFLRLDQRADHETGLYWLAEPQEASRPLSDRVELAIAELLGDGGDWTMLEIDRRICQMFPGNLTPDSALVEACLNSYAIEEEGAIWRLRPEDFPAARAEDEREIRDLLEELGARLGFHVAGDNPIRWIWESTDRYRLHILETAILPRSAEPTSKVHDLYVIPGGRASLFAEKGLRDPRLGGESGSAPRVIKFRHIRRLASDTTLDRSNLNDRLAIDPPGDSDPQLPLL